MSTRRNGIGHRSDGHGNDNPDEERNERPDFEGMGQTLKDSLESIRKQYVTVMTDDIKFARELNWKSTGTLNGYLDKMKTIKATDIHEIKEITTPYLHQYKEELERELRELKGLPDAERKDKEEKYQFTSKLDAIKRNLRLSSTVDEIEDKSNVLLSALKRLQVKISKA